MSHSDLQRAFWDKPNINPRTGRYIKVPGPTYAKLLKEFGTPEAYMVSHVNSFSLFNPTYIPPVTPSYSSSSSSSQIPPVYSPFPPSSSSQMPLSYSPFSSSSSSQMLPGYSPFPPSSPSQMLPVYSPLPPSSPSYAPPVRSPVAMPRKIDTTWKDRLLSEFPKALESTDLDHLIKPFPTITHEAPKPYTPSYDEPEAKYVVDPDNIQRPAETSIYFGNAPAELLPIELVLEITRSLTSEDVKNWAIALAPRAKKIGDYTVVNYLKTIYDQKCILESKGIDAVALSGDFQGVLELEDQGYDITSVLTAANAAKSGNMELIQYLYAKGADFLDPFIKQYALEGGHMPVIHWLEGFGVTFTVGTYQNETIEAAESGSVELMKYMISRYGARPTYSREIKYAACRSGGLELVRFLNEYAGSVNDRQAFRYEGLSDAARSGNLELVQYLVSLGASPRGHDNYGDGPSREALKSGNLELVKWMVAQGVTFSKDDMSHAIRSGNLELVKYLVSLHSSTIFQYNSMTNACHSGNVELVKYIYTHKIDNMSITADVVWMAADSGNLETLKWVFGEYSGLVWREYTRSVENYNNKLTYYLEGNSYPGDFGLSDLKSYRRRVEESYTKLKRLTVPKNAVHGAMDTHNLPMIRWMYQQGADLTDSTSSHVVGKSGDLEIVKWLFSKGIHRGKDVIDGVYYAKYTHGGTKYENLNILYWLHDRGYNVLGHHPNNTLSNYSRRKLTEYVTAHPRQ